MCVLERIGNGILTSCGKPKLSGPAPFALAVTEIALVVIAIIALIVVLCIRSHRNTKAAMAAEAAKNAAAGIIVTPVPPSSLVKTKIIRTVVAFAIAIPVGACIAFCKK